MPATRRTLSFAFLLVILTAALAAYSQTAMQFVAVTPCRVADTRQAPGQFGGPTMGPGTEREGQSWGPMTFAFVLDSTGSGRLIEYDDTTGQGSRGSGALRKANSSAFSLNALNGNWVLGTTGSDHGTRDVQVGQFALNSGNISNGTGDENDGGTCKTSTFTGTVSAVNSVTGRATVTIQSSLGTGHEAIYVVSTGEMVTANTDSSALPYRPARCSGRVGRSTTAR